MTKFLIPVQEMHPHRAQVQDLLSNTLVSPRALTLTSAGPADAHWLMDSPPAGSLSQETTSHMFVGTRASPKVPGQRVKLDWTQGSSQDPVAQAWNAWEPWIVVPRSHCLSCVPLSTPQLCPLNYLGRKQESVGHIRVKGSSLTKLIPIREFRLCKVEATCSHSEMCKQISFPGFCSTLRHFLLTSGNQEWEWSGDRKEVMRINLESH